MAGGVWLRLAIVALLCSAAETKWSGPIVDTHVHNSFLGQVSYSFPNKFPDLATHDFNITSFVAATQSRKPGVAAVVSTQPVVFPRPSASPATAPQGPHRVSSDRAPSSVPPPGTTQGPMPWSDDRG